MGHRTISSKFSELLSSEYVDHYIDLDFGFFMEVSDTGCVLTGQVANANKQSYLKSECGIFNAVSVIVLFNQICFLYLHEVYFTTNTGSCFNGGKGIISEINMVFTKAIRTNNKIPWRIEIVESFDRKGRMITSCELYLSEIKVVANSKCIYLRGDIHKPL